MGTTKQPSKILIIKLSSLGDIVHSLPVLTVLKGKWPDARISWIVNSSYVRILSGHPFLNQVIPFSREKWIQLRCLSKSIIEMLALKTLITRERFELVIDLQGLFKSGAITFFSGAPKRVGFANSRELSYLSYNQRIKLQPGRMHAVDRYLHLVNTLVGQDWTQPSFTLPDFPGKGQFIKEVLASHKIDDQRPIIAICPSARWQSKRWPVERFGKLIGKLSAEGCQMLIVGGEEDRLLGDKLIASVSSNDVVSLAGETDLIQLAAVLEKVDLLVTNDTGPMHLAAAVGTPVVAIFGPTDPQLTGPYGKGHRVLKSSVYCSPCFKKECLLPECLLEISVEDVYTASARYL